VRQGRYRVRTPDQEVFVPVHQVTSIHLHRATRLSYDVVATALEHQTDILFVDRRGFPIGRLWGHQFGSISSIRKNQLVFAGTSGGLEWVRGQLLRKADGQQAVLELAALLRAQDGREVLRRHATYRDRLRQHALTERTETLASFRGYEGLMSRAYFGALGAWLPAPYQFSGRSRQPATDAFNCLLNYAYGMLYGQCESALIRAGLDPFIGILHRDEYNRPVLVYDFIEAYRHWADYVVVHLCVQEVVVDEFFDVQQGQYWLDTIGKRILIQSLNDYLAELVTLEGLSRSRLTHLELDAQRLASHLKKLASPDVGTDVSP